MTPNPGILVALACGWGQYPALDEYGNEACIEAKTVIPNVSRADYRIARLEACRD